jgi:2-polyprenyl-3-methyl-5-hydroxy-6-metoxy-1,4-benzoquinol methylase
MDVGCGNGLLLPKLEAFGSVTGLEIDADILDQDGPYRQHIYTQPLGHRVYRDKQFDLITALDVIEHIEDDDQAIADMVAMLRPGGKLIVTVPAFMALWDEHDEMNMHYRRYTRSRLQHLLQRHGGILTTRYLFHSLFIPKLGVRWANRFRKQKIKQTSLPSRFANRVMHASCSLEHHLLSWANIPFGTSVLAVLEKPAIQPSVITPTAPSHREAA